MGVPWGDLLRLDVSAFELILRTSVIYVGLVVALRIFGRREMGALALPDLLMIVLIADGVQNAMSGEYNSITGGLIVAGTLIGWNYALDWLTFRSMAVRRLLQPQPLKLVEDGRMLRQNMRREMMTKEDLLSDLREQGIEDLFVVKVAYLEPGGELSVIRRTSEEQQASLATGTPLSRRGAV